jgi:membrane protein DedA with SNARE-associated domain
VDWILQTIGDVGYVGIFFLMALESSFFPFPSEVVMIPAGFLAYQGNMNIYGAIASGTAGSLAGALFNYYLAQRIGRPLLLRFGRYVFLGDAALEKIEKYFAAHGEISTFNGRLIPGVRQYISLPAGLARMHLGRFCLYTALGAGLWVAVLGVLGFLLGSQEELLRENLNRLTVAALVLVAVTTLAYYVRHRRKRARREPADSAE